MTERFDDTVTVESEERVVTQGVDLYDMCLDLQEKIAKLTKEIEQASELEKEALLSTLEEMKADLELFEDMDPDVTLEEEELADGIKLELSALQEEILGN